MWSRRVAASTLPRTWTRLAGGRRCPGCQVAETTAASKPVSSEVSTCACAKCGLCWTSESSTVPSRNVFALGPRGGGGGAGAADVVVPGVVVARRVVESLVVAGTVPLGEVVLTDPVVVLFPGEASPPPLPPESTTARITPTTAAAATTAASTAFFTGSEATLARPWPHMSKSS